MTTLTFTAMYFIYSVVGIVKGADQCNVMTMMMINKVDMHGVTLLFSELPQ